MHQIAGDHLLIQLPSLKTVRHPASRPHPKPFAAWPAPASCPALSQACPCPSESLPSLLPLQPSLPVRVCSPRSLCVLACETLWSCSMLSLIPLPSSSTRLSWMGAVGAASSSAARWSSPPASPAVGSYRNCLLRRPGAVHGIAPSLLQPALCRVLWFCLAISIHVHVSVHSLLDCLLARSPMIVIAYSLPRRLPSPTMPGVLVCWHSLPV